MTLSAALRAETGAGAAPRIEELLATADRLIAEAGVRSLTPFVLVERAALAELRGEIDEQATHLRRAHVAFTQMGATVRARAITTALERGATASSSSS